MPALHVRDLPADVLRALKRRAARHHRSLQGELRHLLQQIAEREAPAEALPPIELHLSTASGEGSWSREEIYGDDGR
jgi:plasmid stability protein